MSAADVEPTVPVHVDWDEAYPVFFEVLDDELHMARSTIQMTRAELKRFRNADKEWAAVQDMIRKRSTYR